MKIVHIVESFASGVFQFLVDLTNDYSNMDQIYIVHSLREETPENFKECFRKDINFIYVPQMKRKISLKVLFESRKIITKVLSNIQPDVVHLHSSIAGFIGRLFFSKKYKVIYNPHGYSFLSQKTKFRNWLFYRLEKLAGNKRNTTVACSQSEYELSKKVSKNSVLIPNAIDVNILANLHQEETNNTIITVGRIGFQKNPELFNKIAHLNPNLDFVWIGDGPDKYKLYESNIKITGWLPRTDVLSMVSKAKAFILTSRYEGLSIALLEAMALKKLCIVTNVTGNNSVIDGINGVLFSDETDFVIPSNAREYEENAYRTIIENYSIEFLRKKYTQLYREQIFISR